MTKRRAKKKPETVEVLEVWADGRHYLRLPNGVEIDVPKLEPLYSDSYIFRDAKDGPS